MASDTPAKSPHRADRTPANTLFVRNLHPATTSAKLDAHFSGIGPLRRAFVITDRQTSISKRIAFVTYALPQHAAAAIDALHRSKLSGRPISVELARPRPKRRGDINDDDNNNNNDENDDDNENKINNRNNQPVSQSHGRQQFDRFKHGAQPMRTVILCRIDKGSPDEADVTERLSKVGLKPERVVVVAAGTTLRLTFDKWPSAGRAAATLHGGKFSAVVEALAGTSRATVIVRNLPFTVDVNALRKTFELVKPVRDVRIAVPKEEHDDDHHDGGKTLANDDANVEDGEHNRGSDENTDEDDGEQEDGADGVEHDSKKDENTDDADEDDNNDDDDDDDDSDDSDDDDDDDDNDGSDDENINSNSRTEMNGPKMVKCPGYAFIEFFLVADAKHAMQKLNGSKIGGRVVAVDLAIDRMDYEARKTRIEKEAEQSEMSDGDVEMASSESDDDENTNGEKENAKDDDNKDNNELPNMTSTSPDEKVAPKKKSASSSPEELARTVFVRNLLFESSAHELRSFMLKEFGPVEQAVLVMNKTIGRPRGTAFVRFSTTENADRAVARCGDDVEDSSALSLNGRRLYISKAVDRGRVEEFAKRDGGKGKKEDSRNMHLAWVGLIKRGSEEARGLSEQDLSRRGKAELEKKKKLEHNPNAFVSDVRLSVRNLPRDMDEKTFKQMFIVAAREGVAAKRAKSKTKAKSQADEENEKETRAPGEDVRVTHCKIISNQERNGRSKCFGFVQFARHEDAMHALRRLNNNPASMEWMIEKRPRALRLNPQKERLMREIWGKERRLLVEFAVEDRRMVNVIEKIKEKGRLRAEEARGGGPSDVDKRAKRRARKRVRTESDRDAEGGETSKRAKGEADGSAVGAKTKDNSEEATVKTLSKAERNAIAKQRRYINKLRASKKAQ